MADGLLIPFGMMPTGRMVSAADVPRGLACGCLCPKCKAPLIARQGDVRAFHFAHYVENDCRGAVETALHRFAKQVLCDARLILLPSAHVQIGHHEPERIMWHSRWSYTEAIPEAAIDDVRPDVLLSKPPFRRVAVELFVAHRVGTEKIARLAELALDTIEIDLSEISRSVDAETLRDQVITKAPERGCSMAYLNELEWKGSGYLGWANTPEAAPPGPLIKRINQAFIASTSAFLGEIHRASARSSAHISAAG